MSHPYLLVPGLLGVLVCTPACSRESSAGSGDRNEATTDQAATGKAATGKAATDKAAATAAAHRDEHRAVPGHKHPGSDELCQIDHSASPVAVPPSDKPRLALEGKEYGSGVKETDAVAISEVLQNPDKYAGKRVRVEGEVTGVCPRRGCWFEMAGDRPGDKIRFKVPDGKVVFPMDAKGGYAIAEGVVFTRELSMDDTRRYLQHQAEEYGTDFDPASVTQPMKLVRLDGEGAVIRDNP